MDKAKILDRYKAEEEKLLVSKLFDKLEMVEKRNSVQCMDFVSPVDLRLLEGVLKLIGCNNYVVYGAAKDAQRNMIVIYPCKLEEIFREGKFDFNSVCNCVRIRNVSKEFEHKVYLGGLIKLGVKREKIGDIVVCDDGADIVVSKDIAKFLVSNLNELIRFRNCSVEVVDVEDIVKKEQEFKEMKVIVSSLRLDSMVAELSRTSRSKACAILKQERVFVNYRSESKNTKLLKSGDLVTIRGVGKFVIDGVDGNTRSGNCVVRVRWFK